jgi:hypothetical protein
MEAFSAEPIGYFSYSIKVLSDLFMIAPAAYTNG